MNKRDRKIVEAIFILILFFTNFSFFAYGASDDKVTEFNINNVQKTANGADVKLSSSEVNNNELSINMSTKGLDKGYYTAYIYENKNRDWTNYEAVAFDVENKSENEIKINLNVKESTGSLVSVYDNSIVLLKRNDSELLEAIHPLYGAIEISKDFKGTIYIPFNSLKEKDEVGTKPISKISSFGIIAVLPENQEAFFVLNKFVLINKGSNLSKYFNLNLLIRGEDLVEIPVAGEGISNYTVESDNKESLSNRDIKFQLCKPVTGVSLSSTGKLTLTPDVEAQKIQICAVIDKNISQTIEVQLVKSWTLDAKEVDGASKSIPKPNEVPEIVSNEKNILMDKNILIGTRITIVLITIAFGIVYMSWNKQRK